MSRGDGVVDIVEMESLIPNEECMALVVVVVMVVMASDGGKMPSVTGDAAYDGIMELFIKAHR
jgi:hypothetical protein